VSNRLLLKSADDLTDRWLAAYARRAEAEENLVASVLADPAWLQPLAREAGIRDSHFDEDDFLILWLAAGIASKRGKTEVLRLARNGMIDAGIWWSINSELPVGCSKKYWSNPRLAHIACSWYPCASIVKHHVAQLLEIVGQIEAARELFRLANETLNKAGDRIPKFQGRAA